MNCSPMVDHCADSEATPHAAAATATEGQNDLLRDPVTSTADAIMAAPAEAVIEVLSEL